MALLMAVACTLIAVSPVSGPGHHLAKANDQIGGATITVLAASSLKDAMEAIAAHMRATGGPRLVVATAASSTLARQIEAGAPGDIFASASPQWMDYLAERGLIATGSRSEAFGNALVLIAPAGTASVDVTGTASLTELLARLPGDARLAVADPAHVPAGIYARQTLEKLGLWPQFSSRLAMADNVRGALALVARGEAPLGLVYATDAALSREVAVVAQVSGDLHDPIVYPFALVAGRDTALARQTLDVIVGEQGRTVFAELGFAVLKK